MSRPEPRLGLNRENTDNKSLSYVADNIYAVVSAFEDLRDAKTLGEQSGAYQRLADAVSDLETYHPDFDFESGIIWTEDLLQERHGDF